MSGFCAVAATALLAVFALDRNMVILLMILFGASMGVALTTMRTGCHPGT
jgi:hypothetical protein